jgi:acyl dehydratase
VPGLLYAQLTPGEVYRHAPSRTVTETDNVLFCALTMNPQPLHLDAEFAARSQYGERLVNGMYTLSLILGLSVMDLTLGTTGGNLGFGEVRFLGPVLIGDTITAESEVLAKRHSRSKPQFGVVEFEHRARNQREELVVTCRRAGLMHLEEPSA